VTLTVDPAPGDVGATLRVGKSAFTPGNIELSWGQSCSTGVADYAIYEGTIGSYGVHLSVLCTDAGGDRVEEVVPQTASSYYLVVPISPTAEGSYGQDSGGFERPVAPALDRCLASQVIGGCP
jgi:hypothetical protein